ncbi:hypothetical protein SAMN00017405_1222 [Desulfonispora thiosulfatigenes DSM 11270]|uniref:Uncharacterized protein n=1 Tax=Desulfonispora thiosulfatigenes DSM 11270 TaxID=656914 RepID=A0A1W1V143_DESTI|nr:hypothetical protein [Desulfonispora thiosulfatigenes]SMB87030.1 hypothetical protein SAMN00017405_1222 [Desulfonispora thiosulfatigenes DSM 11270]
MNLIDLDLVEPFYTLRPLKEELENKGLNVLAHKTKDAEGLGETGVILKGEMKWALRLDGDVVMDIGYGVEGAKTLNLIEDKASYPEFKIYVVVNIGRPMTSEVGQIIEYIKTLGIVHGLINNAHLGKDTDIGFIEEGAKIVTAAAKELNLPVIATTVDARFKEIGQYDSLGNPVRPLNRYMQRAFW